MAKRTLAVAFLAASAGAAGALSVAGSLVGGVAVGGAADAAGLSVGVGVEAAAGPYRGFQPRLGAGYTNRDYSPTIQGIGSWERGIGEVAIYHISAGCEYALLRGALFGAFGSGGFVWAWEEAELSDFEGIDYTRWSDSAPGLYAGAGVELWRGRWSLGLAPRYTVLFDNVPKTYIPGREIEITYAKSPSQFVDVLFRVKYSF